MAFDIAGALKAGYSQDDIAQYLSKEHDFDYDGAVKAGYQPNQIVQHILGHDQTFGQQAWGVGKNLLSGAMQTAGQGLSGIVGYVQAGDQQANAQNAQIEAHKNDSLGEQIKAAFLPPPAHPYTREDKADVEATPAYQAGQGITGIGRDITTKYPSGAENLAQSAGGFLPYLVPGVGLPMMIGAGFSEGSQNAAQAGQNLAQQQYAGEQGGNIQGIIGSLPFEKGVAGVAGKLLPKLTGKFAQRVVQRSIGDAAMMGSLQAGGNYNAADTYAPDTPLTQGVPEAMLTGAIAGTLFHSAETAGGAAKRGLYKTLKNTAAMPEGTGAPETAEPPYSAASGAGIDLPPLAEPQLDPAAFPHMAALESKTGLPQGIVDILNGQEAAVGDGGNPTTAPTSPMAVDEGANQAPEQSKPSEPIAQAPSAPDAMLEQAAGDVDSYRAPTEKSGSILQAISDLGGVRTKDANGDRILNGPDIPTPGKDFKKYPPGTFDNNSPRAMTPSQMQDALAEQGWFGHGDIPETALEDAMRRSQTDNPLVHPDAVAETLANGGPSWEALHEEMMQAGVQPKDTREEAAQKLSDLRTQRLQDVESPHSPPEMALNLAQETPSIPPEHLDIPPPSSAEDYGNTVPPEPPALGEPTAQDHANEPQTAGTLPESAETPLAPADIQAQSSPDFNNYFRQTPVDTSVDTGASEVAQRDPKVLKAVTDKIKSEFNRRGLGSLGARIVDHLEGPAGSDVHGMYDPSTPEGAMVKLATDVYEPNITDEQMSARMLGVADHEMFHHIQAMGVLKPNEIAALDKAAARQKAPGDNLTHLERAQANYPHADERTQKDEAQAEMFRHWAENGRRVTDHPTGILNKLWKTMVGMIRSIGRANPERIFQKIDNGEIAQRAVESASALNQAERLMASPKAQKEAALRAGQEVARANAVQQSYEENAARGPAAVKHGSDRIIAQYASVQTTIQNALRNGRLGERGLGRYVPVPRLNEEQLRKFGLGFTGLTRRASDLNHSMAVLVRDVHDAGGRGLDMIDPRKTETFLTGRQQNGLLALHDGLESPMLDKIGRIQATEGQMNDLIKRLPKDSYAQRLWESGKYDSPSHALFNLYVTAKDAINRNDYIENTRQQKILDPSGSGKEVINDAGSGMSTPEAKDIISHVESSPLNDRMQEARSAARSIIEFTNGFRVEKGTGHDWPAIKSALDAERAHLTEIINAPLDKYTHEQIDDAQKKLPKVEKSLASVYNDADYVPLRGHLIDEEGAGDTASRAGAGAGGGVRGNEDPHMLGRTSISADVVSNIMNQAQQAVIRGERNQLYRDFGNMIRLNPEKTAGWASILSSPPQGPKLDPITKQTVISEKDGWRQSPEYLIYKENGNEVIVHLQRPDLQEMMGKMASMGDPVLEKGLNMIGHGTKFMGDMATTHNPLFAFLLFPRHTQAAMINATAYEPGISASIGIESVKALAELTARAGHIPNPKLDADLKALNAMGAMSGIYSQKRISSGVEDLNKHFANADKHDGVYRAPMLANYMGKVADFTRGINNTAEWATRVGVYRAFLKAGYSPERAGQLAKETTINFDRTGGWTKNIGKFFMFVNAGVQADAAMLRGMFGSRTFRRIMGAIMLSGYMQSWAGKQMGGVNPATGNFYYDELPDEDFEKNMVFMRANGQPPIKIPIPFEFAAIHNSGRLISEAQQGRISAGQAITGTLKSFVNNFDPMTDVVGKGFNALMPTVVRPIADIESNNSWNGSQVRPELDEYGVHKVPSDMHFAHTSGFFIGLAKALAKINGGDGMYRPSWLEQTMPKYMEPDSMEYLFHAYLGGGARLMTMAGNAIEAKTNPDKFAAEGRVQDVGQIPIIGTFTIPTGPRTEIQHFQNMEGPIKQLYKSWDEANRDGQTDYANELLAKYPYALTSGIAWVKSADEGISAARRAIRNAQNNPRLTTAQIADQVRTAQLAEQAAVEKASRQLHADTFINRNDVWDLKGGHSTYAAPEQSALAQ